MFDFTRYAELKAKGAVLIEKKMDTAVIFVRKFDQLTGKELVPDMGPINVADIHNARAQAISLTAALDELLKDLQVLGIDTTPAGEKVGEAVTQMAAAIAGGPQA